MDRISDRPTRGPPSLLCLNLRAEWTTQDPGWIAPAQTVLLHAREHHWRIAHAHCQSALVAGEILGAIPGLEPTRHEPVFTVQGLSAFHSTSVWQWAGLSRGDIYMIGSVFGLAGAATVVGAHVLGLPLTLISEACGEAKDGQLHVNQTRVHMSSLTRAIRLDEALGRRASAAVIKFQRKDECDGA